MGMPSLAQDLSLPLSASKFPALALSGYVEASLFII
jgi:hypothetical protein